MNISRQAKQAFHNSKTWRMMSRLHLIAYPWCQCDVCNDNGIDTPAVETHHRIDIDSDFSQALTWSNLMSVSKECHSRLTMTANMKAMKEAKQSKKYDDITQRLFDVAINRVSGG
jgi:5-methylcytosine-specific restriction endonuclease McrA